MELVPFLHFYQPHNQQQDILNRIVNESYRPLVKGLLNNKNARLTININGALVELLIANGYDDVIEDMKALLKSGQVEITSSAMYHAFLPLLPKQEIKRQIELNIQTNNEYFGEAFKPKGFFSPEMAINSKVLDVIKDFKYEWIGAPEVALKEGELDSSNIYKEKNTGLKVLFRNKEASNVMLTAQAHNPDDFYKQIKPFTREDGYVFLVMDAETFGHHRVGFVKFLFDVINHKNFESFQVQEILQKYAKVKEIELRPSTWTNQEQDFWLDKNKTDYTEAKSFILWKDPKNPIHKMQWELLDLAVKLVNDYPNKDSSEYKKARISLDKAEASDQFWWASTNPWWSLEMIEQGAYELKDLIGDLYGNDSQEFGKALKLYRGILDKAFEWQRSGIIRKKHIQNSSTYMKEPFSKRVPMDWGNLLILELEKAMQEAAQKNEYELAIKWRDALVKIKTETDKYDILHVVDEFWSHLGKPTIKPFFEHEWSEFSDYIKNYLIGIDSKEDFEKYKKQYKKSD